MKLLYELQIRLADRRMRRRMLKELFMPDTEAVNEPDPEQESEPDPDAAEIDRKRQKML